MSENDPGVSTSGPGQAPNSGKGTASVGAPLPDTPLRPTAQFIGFAPYHAVPHTEARAQLCAEIERIRSTLETRSRSSDLILELRVFITGDLIESQILTWLEQLLDEPFPLITVVLVDELPHQAPLSVEAISVPYGPRFELTGTTGFPDLLRIGDFVVALSIPEPSEDADIVATTHTAMDALTDMLKAAGCSVRDIVKYNIFYLGNGTVENWSASSQARAEIFTGPGPATTGVPVRALARPTALIQFTMFGKVGSRTMNGSATARPDHHWDWPIPLPHFHGNRVQELGFIGGQVSLAEDASVLFPGDHRAQVRQSIAYIERVLVELRRAPCDLTRLTVFYEVGDETTQRGILAAIAQALPTDITPEISLVGMDKLAYPDMVIEIEAQFERQP